MAKRKLLNGPTTLSSATVSGRNVLQALSYPEKRDAFYQRIEGYRPLLCDAVAYHLRMKSQDVVISPQDYWLHGSFNLVVPMALGPPAWPGAPEFAALRFPLPFRVGEEINPGNCDEKLNCEAATYAWLQQNCPSVPIPQLYGFGLSTGEKFVHVDFLPWWLRYYHLAYRYVLRILGFAQPSHYVNRPSPRLANLDIGYLLIESISDADGRILSLSWDEKKDDARLQSNLQRSLAKIMVTISSIPLPRIGAFRMDHSGYLHLDNRPLFVQGTIQENEAMSIGVPRDQTLSRVDDFVRQQLDFLDERLLRQPNAVNSELDGWHQMTSLAAARIIFPRMFRKELNSGPFVYTLTDLHRSNIFVDEDWNIKRIIDLEYACSWPIEFVQPPAWLDGKFVNLMRPPDFAATHGGFIEHVRDEEQRLQLDPGTNRLSSTMQEAWTTGAFWATVAFHDPLGFVEIFYESIIPFHQVFLRQEEDISHRDIKFFSHFWRPKAHAIVEQKTQEQASYLKRLEAAFADGPQI